MKTVNINGYAFTVPDDFKHVLWSEVEHNQRVFIIGTNNKVPYAYGPYSVVNKDTKELMNRRKEVFCENAESLLVEI
jgi:hypothetical protein